MDNILLQLHNILRWVILLFMFIAIIQSISGLSSNKPFTKGSKLTSLFLLIVTHITVLIGIYQWVVGPWGLKNIQNLGMAAVMKDSASRFWAVEHISGMLIAAILITIANRTSKLSKSDKQKYKRNFWLYIIALALILISIPWPFRESICRPWFPHM